ncbi:MAG: T9SS type A sorting domain-containing protein [Candidatus Fermentibacteraceae bacterium]|nr:T9SS type A sorting domain-containing protein [Candidatus Fermentibacteraceae bacterium]
MRYRHSSLTLLVMITLLFTVLSYGVDPPVKLWERQYYAAYDGAKFSDIELTNSGMLFLTGSAYDFTYPFNDNFVAYLLNLDGDVIWEVMHPFYRAFSSDGCVLSDGSFAITGKCLENTNSSVGLYLEKISPDGTIMWSKIYDYPDTKEEGYGITCLPDGGFAVCGKVNGTGQWAGDAWFLRTDSQGDTLWTRTWGTFIENYGKSVVFNNGEICFLAKGGDDTLTTQGTHLLFYDLDGNYLRGTDYGDVLEYLLPADMCIASDGGYTFTTKYFPPVWHTDQYGETLWWQSIYVTPNDWHKGYCIRRTMDSGYIFSGWDGYYEYEPDGNLTDYEEGWLARFDSEGNELWNINNTISVNHAFYSVVQLPEGGYMACGAYNVWKSMNGNDDQWTHSPLEDMDGVSRGSTGFLVRYAPETGITSPDSDSSLSVEVFPNPFSSVLSVSFNLPESGEASVLIYDLSGRLVGTVADEVFPAGENTVQWTVPGSVSSGCYLLRYNAGLEPGVKTVVLIK